MKSDPVPGLLGRAAEVLAAEFARLPGFAAATEATDEAIALVLDDVAHRWATTILTFTLCTPGRCSSRLIRWLGQPMHSR